MSEQLIRSLFEGRLRNWASGRAPQLPVAWENVPLTPPAGVYLQAWLLRGDTTSRDLEGANRHRVGVFQVNIVCPGGNGPGVAEGIAGELEAIFPMNLILSSGAFSVTQTSPLRVRPALPTDRYTVPVDLQYRADTYPT